MKFKKRPQPFDSVQSRNDFRSEITLPKIDTENIVTHVTFTFVGVLLFIGAGMLTGRMRYVLLLVPGKAIGMFGAFLLFTPMYVYQVYPAFQQVEAGLVMVVIMLVMDLTIVPYWLYNYFGKISMGSGSRKINKP